MKWYLLIVLFAVVVGVGYWLSVRNSPESSSFSCAAQSQKPVIVAFGDSLVEGYGAPEQHGFVDPLATQLGTTIINEGKSGDTTGQALQRLPDVLAQNPNIVIVLLGGNDALQQIPTTTTKANLSEILKTLTDAHIHVVLVGVLGGILTDPYAPMFRDLTKEYNVTLVPNILNGLIGNDKYMYDQVHPNNLGYSYIAAKLYPVLNSACRTFENS